MLDILRFGHKLTKHGFEQLGSGCSSTVYAKPGKDRCIKVGTCTDWEPYVRWSHETGYAGTFAPKVYAFHRWERRYYTAVVERLTETVKQNYCRTCDDSIYRAVDRYDWKTLEPMFPGIMEFAEHAEIAGMSGDWHTSNWMLHGNRLVLVDTFSRGPGGEKRRWHPVRELVE